MLLANSKESRQVTHQVVSLGHEVGDIVAIEESQLEAEHSPNSKDENNVDQAKLEGGLSLLFAFVLRFFL